MKIEIDGVIYAFVLKAFHEFSGERMQGKRHQEALFLNALESLVMLGAATRRHNDQLNVEEFRTTDRLVQNWSYFSPNEILTASRDDLTCLKVKGRRSKLFPSNWGVPEPDDLLPDWPR